MLRKDLRVNVCERTLLGERNAEQVILDQCEALAQDKEVLAGPRTQDLLKPVELHQCLDLRRFASESVMGTNLLFDVL